MILALEVLYSLQILDDDTILTLPTGFQGRTSTVSNWIGIGLERKLRTSFETVNEILAEIIPSRREEKEIHKLLKRRNDKFIRDVVFSLLLAGRDTTNSVLTWFFWLLSKHPHVMSKINHEINTKLVSEAEEESSKG
ncbi:unnamed protein product [Arabidopsis thaliana]|uniref:(thale cress) hypothetical protein n=1 Tax=Arabidopsis thaliana TaxID=3702 RepID=A0A5S9WML1_ARATH|nr:unnamed protein product [Arabidopsis thaliana]CAD5315769.1 unnamed protein product [Arabidopsis thaliana]VYS49364.1 unnamed protein product [Arabidopsis thaliana]